MFGEIAAEQTEALGRYLREDEREPATVRKYLRNVGEFAAGQGERDAAPATPPSRSNDHLLHFPNRPLDNLFPIW